MKKSLIVLSTICLVASLNASAQSANLGSVKTYLLERINAQKAATAGLKNAAQRYYDLAKAAQFDYKKLNTSAVRAALLEARAGWSKASPIYESVEGIVAGVEVLSAFDLNLDAGASKAEGGDAIVEFDLNLANGTTLEKPGNAFGVNEGALWGTEKTFSSGVAFDVDGNGKIGFGDQLPEANVLKSAADKLDALTGELISTAKTWTPAAKDVFGALTANVPTVAPVFLDRWKTSRFVIGDKATRRDFNVISSLSDLSGNITSWQKLYAGVSASVKTKNAGLDAQIQSDLTSLKAWAVKLEAQESKRRFTPEQAQTIMKEGDNRATAITGKIAQAAALVGVKL
jgi:Imelysin